MEKNLRHNLEKLFRDSNSIDALFDAFQILIFKKIDDLNLFKILLANPTLSPDELKFFTDKISSEFKHQSYEVFYWTATIFETKFGCNDYAFNYYVKTINVKPFKYEPFLNLISLFDYEMDTLTNRAIIEFVENAVEFVDCKSKVFNFLASHYLKTGNDCMSRIYEAKAEQSQRDECED
ncbi:MAG: hypothetical protein ACEPO8_05000 [Rhodothermaceae bacterium]